MARYLAVDTTLIPNKSIGIQTRPRRPSCKSGPRLLVLGDLVRQKRPRSSSRALSSILEPDLAVIEFIRIYCGVHHGSVDAMANLDFFLAERHTLHKTESSSFVWLWVQLVSCF